MSSIATYREHGHRDAIAPADDPTVSTNLVRTAAVTPRLFVIVTEGDNRVPLSHAGRVPNAESARRQPRDPYTQISPVLPAFVAEWNSERASAREPSDAQMCASW